MARSPAEVIPGRNSPCPCGSGKRYKDCHGTIAAEDLPPSAVSATGIATRASQYRAPDPEWTHLSVDQQDALGITMEAALAHQTAGHLPEAAELYREVLKSAPETHDALHMLGVIEWELGDLDRGEALILEAMALRPPYWVIEGNLQLLRDTRIERSRAIEDELAERALPILNDLILGPSRSSLERRPAAPASNVIHFIGRFRGADDDDATLCALERALAPRPLKHWTSHRGGAFAPDAPGCTAIDPLSGRYPTGGTHVFVGVNHDLRDWIERADADRVIVLCGRGRASVYLSQLRAIALDGARRIELVFVSRSRAERFGSGHVVVPVPTYDASNPAINARPDHSVSDAATSKRPWTAGIVGQISDRVEKAADADFIAEVGHRAGALAMYDPGPYRFLLGASRSTRFVERTSDGTRAFLSGIDCLYCRRQPWWDEDDGRGILAAMALGLPVICPRESIHAEFIEDRVDGLLYDGDDEGLAVLTELRRAGSWAADLSAAARTKATVLLDPVASLNALRSLFPESERLASVSA